MTVPMMAMPMEDTMAAVTAMATVTTASENLSRDSQRGSGQCSAYLCASHDEMIAGIKPERLCRMN